MHSRLASGASGAGPGILPAVDGRAHQEGREDDEEEDEGEWEGGDVHHDPLVSFLFRSKEGGGFVFR